MGAVVWGLYERQKNFPAGEAITPLIVLLVVSQLIGLLLVCLKNSRVGAVICMPSSFVAGVAPILMLMTEILHLSGDEPIFGVGMLATMALTIFLLTIPWIAANPGEKKKQTDK